MAIYILVYAKNETSQISKICTLTVKPKMPDIHLGVYEMFTFHKHFVS